MPKFTQQTQTRPDDLLSRLLVGKDYRIFDRTCGDTSVEPDPVSLAFGEVVGLDPDTGHFVPYAGQDTIGVVAEEADIEAGQTLALPVIQSGAVKLSELVNAPAAWKVGEVRGLLILT